MSETIRDREGHVLGELGFVLDRTDDGFSGHTTIVPEMCVPGTTSVRLSILATAVDWLAGLVAIDRIRPRVPVTLELDVHAFEELPGAGTLRAVSRLVKGGRTVTVAGVDLFHSERGRIAFGAASFMTAPDPDLVLPADAGDPAAIASITRPLERPFAERAGCERQAPGVAVLHRAEDGLNASNSINGGLIALAVEEAALSLTPDTTLSTLAMRYLRPVRVGPARATAEVERGLGVVEVVDAGDDDRTAVVATTRAFGTAA